MAKPKPIKKVPPKEIPNSEDWRTGSKKPGSYPSMVLLESPEPIEFLDELLTAIDDPETHKTSIPKLKAFYQRFEARMRVPADIHEESDVVVLKREAKILLQDIASELRDRFHEIDSLVADAASSQFDPIRSLQGIGRITSESGRLADQFVGNLECHFKEVSDGQR